jgi:hypothetical protein
MRFFLILALSGFLLVSCTEDKDPVKAIVNGIEIKTSQAPSPEVLDQKIEGAVIQTEAKRIGVSEKELFEFFDTLKTRNIPKDQLEEFMKKEFKDKNVKKQSRDEILGLMREKQFEEARKRYISELKNRSTIWVMVDGQKLKYQTLQK